MYICPNCQKPLTLVENTYCCKNNHRFDLSKYGYVNLLQSQKSSAKRHGDDTAMVVARRAFLQAGHYDPLLQQLIQACQVLQDGDTLLDVGCGECYYTAGIADALKSQGKRVQIGGVDISKDALRYGAKRLPQAKLAVGSAFKLPVAQGGAHAILNVFAPSCPEQFHRVLKQGGTLIRAVPKKEHLFELKAAIYQNPYYNKEEPPVLAGFELVSQQAVEYTLALDDPEQIKNLFMMTPYYYKTSVADQQKLLALPTLQTKVSFDVQVFKWVK